MEKGKIEGTQISGVLNILSFNQALLRIWHYSVGCGYEPPGFSWPDLLYWLIVSAFLYGLIMPLLVSAYVYDFQLL
ncbi:MAG: hypothetical protein WKF59_00670 [Chitinophagaceae bacterium]